MELKQSLAEYFKLQQSIFDYFGYEQQWTVFPIDDRTAHHWMIVGGEGSGGTVVYSDDPFSAESISSGMKIYSAEIYTQRHLGKWVYRAVDFTMILADTGADNNRLLMIFDNAKECKDESLKEEYSVAG